MFSGVFGVVWFHAGLVSCWFGFMLVWFLAMIFADEFVIGLHAKFLGIHEANLDRFTYDAKMIMYLLMGVLKLAAMLLFFIPWLVLRFSRK